MADHLLTPRDWQAEATVRAAKLAGSPEGALALVEAKRYGALAEQIERLRGLAAGASRAIQADAITVNLVRLAGLPKDKARECESIVRQVLAHLIADGATLPPAPQTVAWRVRGYSQFRSGKPGPWRYFDGPTQPMVNDPDCCDFEPLSAPSAGVALPSAIPDDLAAAIDEVCDWLDYDPPDGELRDDIKRLNSVRLRLMVEQRRAARGVMASDDWQQYAKDGETAQACIERHRAEIGGLLKLLAHARGEPLSAEEIIALLPAGWTGMLAQVMEFARRIERARGVAVPQAPKENDRG